MNKNKQPVVYYTMDFIEMGDFYDLINESNFISEKLAISFLTQILSALKQLHSKKIYHFDLKPENILIDPKGQIYLCDFGHSLHLKDKSNKWKNFRLISSIEYSAPELH